MGFRDCYFYINKVRTAKQSDDEWMKRWTRKDENLRGPEITGHIYSISRVLFFTMTPLSG